MLANGTTQEKALFALALATGARLCELLGVTWDRVDLKDVNHALVQFAKQLVLQPVRAKDGTLTPPLLGEVKAGPRNVSMTLSIYAHALPDQQRGAAERLGAVLHG